MKIIEMRTVKRHFPDDGNFLSGDEYYVDVLYLLGLPCAAWWAIIFVVLFILWCFGTDNGKCL